MDVATTSRSWPRIVLSSALVVLSVVVLYATPPPEPRYLMVDEVVAQAAELEGARLRVHGWVVAGSIQRIDRDTTMFDLRKAGATLRVLHDGVLPDTFKDQSEVVVVGSLGSDGFFAEQLMAKCATKYEADPNRDVTTIYK